MRKLPKPTQKTGDVYALCTSKVRNPNLRQRLQLIKPTIVARTKQFERAVADETVHGLSGFASSGNVTSRELVNVYKYRMARTGAPGREVYDRILNAPPQGRCPLCGQRDASTIDHYLPESQFSTLSVSPPNLVPSCKDCNFDKGTDVPSSPEKQLFHPYYDNFDDAIWLKAAVRQQQLCIKFLVRSPRSWNRVKIERAKYHFQKLNLAKLYSKHAASELVGLKELLRTLHEAGGKDAVKNQLAMMAKSHRAAQTNSWQTALYRATAADPWFCDIGFDQF